MQIFLRFIVLITLSLLGALLFALSINLMIATRIIDTTIVYSGFGNDVTYNAVLVWVVCNILGIISVFIEQKWRYALLLSPLLAPSLYGFAYALFTS
jgi:hypothetical protein